MATPRFYDADAVVRETERAFLLQFPAGEVWVPRKLCQERDQGNFGRIVSAPMWFLARKGLDLRPNYA